MLPKHFLQGARSGVVVFIWLRGTKKGSESSRARAILRVGSPLSPRDLQNITIDPGLTRASAASSEIEWAMKSSGSRMIASAIRRRALFRVGRRPWMKGNRAFGRLSEEIFLASDLAR